MPVPHPSPLSGALYSAVELAPEDDAVILLDQRRLPSEERYLRFHDYASVAQAIADLVVRGAPAIGITAGYALAIEAHRHANSGTVVMQRALAIAGDVLIRARPTAVNLAWAVRKILSARPERAGEVAELARQIHREDVAACRALGARGAKYLPHRGTILTHCNAGALATGGYGSALGVIRAAIEAGATLKVLACETRPYLQGARITAWELQRDGIDVEICTDAMPASFFARGEIDAVVVGADRIARNGDVANKIGTYAHAVVAHFHARPFYVAAPTSTLDPSCARGADITIEERSGDEVSLFGGLRIAPSGVRARHPAFDITPAHLVTRIFTEVGDVPGPDIASLM